MYLGLVLGVLPQMVGAALQRECTRPALGPVPRPLGRGLLAAVVFCDLLIQRPDKLSSRSALLTGSGDPFQLPVAPKLARHTLTTEHRWGPSPHLSPPSPGASRGQEHSFVAASQRRAHSLPQKET